MSDLIDRQALLRQIDIDSDGEPGYYGDTWKFIDTIKRMPPALGTNLAQVGTDLISRQQAIDALDKRFDSIPMEQTTEILLLRKDLRNLPSAQPQRMRGKWTYGEDEYGIDGYHCDKCGFFVPWDYTHKFIDFIKDYHFCPNCGADMRGEQDGSNKD